MYGLRNVGIGYSTHLCVTYITRKARSSPLQKKRNLLILQATFSIDILNEVCLIQKGIQTIVSTQRGLFVISVDTKSRTF